MRRSFSYWAFSRLDELVRSDPEVAWNVIGVIYQLDSTDQILANLAAGPVEDLLVYHGDRFIDRVETLAKSDAIFRKLLGAVWQNEIPESVWKRVRAVAGPSF